MKQIRNVRELRESLARGNCEFRLRLKGGAFSRKSILLREDGAFNVLNGIDGSLQRLTGRELYSQSLIGRAMRQGAFVEDE